MDKITLIQTLSSKLKFSTITYLVNAVISYNMDHQYDHATIDIKAKHSGHNFVPAKSTSLNSSCLDTPAKRFF